MTGLFHGPGWTPRATFVPDVHRFSRAPAWVTEWQYGVVRPLLAERAEVLVWLDLPRAVVMRQLVRRTLRRRVRREELFHGNVEPPLRTVLTDPEHIVRWAWRTHAKTTTRVQRVLASNDAPAVVRLRDRREVHAWLAGPVAALATTP